MNGFGCERLVHGFLCLSGRPLVSLLRKRTPLVGRTANPSHTIFSARPAPLCGHRPPTPLRPRQRGGPAARGHGEEPRGLHGPAGGVQRGHRLVLQGVSPPTCPGSPPCGETGVPPKAIECGSLLDVCTVLPEPEATYTQQTHLGSEGWLGQSINRIPCRRLVEGDRGSGCSGSHHPLYFFSLKQTHVGDTMAPLIAPSPRLYNPNGCIIRWRQGLRLATGAMGLDGCAQGTPRGMRTLPL